jgi:hypothetical protein
LINKILEQDKLDYSSESSDCKDIEYASDDEQDQLEGLTATKKKRRGKKKDEVFCEKDM